VERLGVLVEDLTLVVLCLVVVLFLLVFLVVLMLLALIVVLGLVVLLVVALPLVVVLPFVVARRVLLVFFVVFFVVLVLELDGGAEVVPDEAEELPLRGAKPMRLLSASNTET
jgi:hypothetical protein